MAELVKRTIIGAVVNVGEVQAPARGPDGEELDRVTVKVLVITDLDDGIETTVYIEPSVEGTLAQALAGGVAIFGPSDMPRGNSS